MSIIGNFTIRADPNAENDISEDINRVVDRICTIDLPLDALYLVGSYGRGEGGCWFNGKRWCGQNDYDFLVITSEVSSWRAPLSKLSGEMADLLNIDFVDIGCMPRKAISRLSPTIFNFDLRYGGRLLYGEELKGEIPSFSAKDIDVFEFIQLLCNRSAGIITTRFSENLESCRLIRNQYTKLCLSVMDAIVYLESGYDVSLLARVKLFREIVDSEKLSNGSHQDLFRIIQRGVNERLYGERTNDFFIKREQVIDLLSFTFSALANQSVLKKAGSIKDAEIKLWRRYRTTKRFRDYPKFLYWRCFRKEKILSDFKLRILLSLPVLSTYLDRNRMIIAMAYLARYWWVPNALGRAFTLRSAYNLWTIHFH